MAFRYLIYSTGTTYSGTILRESASSGTTSGEKAYYTDFVIPEIQPLYLWQVDNVTTPTDVIPNTDANINAYLAATAPAPQPEDDASVGYVTGITTTKIDKVTGATGNLGTFNASGNLDDAGLTIAQLTGLTTYTFTGSGGTIVSTNGNAINVFSAPPTGTTVSWGSITGTLSGQTDLQNALNLKLDITDFNSYTGTTATLIGNKLDTTVFNSYTGTSQPILDAALTGVTNLGTGTTLGLTSGRNVTFKSVSVLGGLTLSGDADNLIISGGSSGGGAWGTITGTLSDQTDLWDTLTGMTATTANKLDTSVFNTFTGTTLPANYYNKTEINSYTGATATLIGTKLNTTDFNTFTGTTLPANYYNKTEINSYTGATDLRIDAIEVVTNIALTGATNGLTTNGRNVELGGTLTKNTVISGTTFDFTVNSKSVTLQAINGINIIDTDGVGGINIESDAGTIAIVGNTNLGVEKTKLEISETQMLITDSRTGATRVGLEYAGDYSTTFTNESLITKRYADTIASGLIPKAAVNLSTTVADGDIDLTGGTFVSGTTIDAVVVQDGWRVLVTQQTSAVQNGIYVYSASASGFTRSSDFDGNPSGEVTSGNLIPVISGVTQYNTIWVLVTPNPIVVGTTPLEFTLFSSPHQLIAGIGITILANTISVDGSSLAGNSIAWTGNTFNVDVASGTLATVLGTKLDITDFNYYSGTTVPATYLSINNFNTFTGTTLPANYYNKTEINSYTGATDTRLTTIESDITGLSATTATKLDTAVFNSYTGATAPNEIFLIHTGGTELNTILASAIEWDAEGVTGATGAAFSWTGSSEIQVLETGLYEVSYNIPYNINSNSSIGVGANLILNNLTVIDVTAAAGLATRVAGAASVGLPTVILSLTANDVLNLATFRTHQSGSATSSLTGSILIKRKNTLQ